MSRRLVLAGAGVALAAIGALAVPALRHVREAPPVVRPETRTDIVTRGTDVATDDPGSFAVSPDGRHLVFVASAGGASRLWHRPLNSTTATPLDGTEDAHDPFWSPDSGSIGYFAGDKLKRVNLGGDAPLTVATAPFAFGGTWSAAGDIVFWGNPTPLQRVPASGGTPVTIQGAGTVWSACFLPDGRLLTSGRRDSGSVISLLSLDGSSTPTLLSIDGPGDVAYLPSGTGDTPGWLLWTREGAVVVHRFDAGRAVLEGQPITIASGVGAVSVAQDGTIAYRSADVGSTRLMWVNRSGIEEGGGGGGEWNGTTPRISPDGRRVAVLRSVAGNADLWVLEGSRANRFTFDPGVDRYPVWSPGGDRIAFYSTRQPGHVLYVKDTGGGGAEVPLVTEGRIAELGRFGTPSSWSADGRFLLFYTFDPKTSGGDIWALPMEGERVPFAVVTTPANEREPMFSPDGRWVAFQSNESGRPEIYVRPFIPPTAGAPAATGAAQWQVSTAGGVHPTWRADGKEMYYLDPSGAMMAVPISVRGTALIAGTPVRLFPTRVVGGSTQETPLGRQYDVGPDGRFLINTIVKGEVPPITLLMNWRPVPPR